MRVFELERYFSRYEFQAKYLLSASDCEPLSLSRLLESARPETLKRWENLRFNYTETMGDPQLREEIAALYQTLSPEQIQILAPSEGIYIAISTMLRKSERFIALLPAYQSLYEIGTSSGCKLDPVLLEAREGRWHLDLERLKRQITPRTRLLVLNFPHNPTGYLPSRAELDEILEIARKNNLLIFSDEMYRPLSYRAEDTLPSLADLYEGAVVLSGVSKTHSLPGLRIGWLATRHAALMKNFRIFRDYTTICSSAPSEILALMGLQNGKTLVEENQRRLGTNMALARDFCLRHGDLFEWLPPGGSSVAFPRWKGETSIAEIADRLISETGVMLLPGTVFDEGGQHLRLGLGRNNFPEALAVFEKWLSD